MSKYKILFQITGSIACYKACGAISRLVQAGHEVQVAASAAALKFVGEATLEGLTGKKVLSDLWSSGQAMDHIHFVRWADVIVVAPATANFINKIAHGLGDDLLSTMFLAHDFKKPYLLAPAMNASMYRHPITQASFKKLRGLGLSILHPGQGTLACGEIGEGRLPEPEVIVNAVANSMKSKFQKPKGKLAQTKAPEFRVLVTSGGTKVPIDSVRSIANNSTGETGALISNHLSELGFSVTHFGAKKSAVPGAEVHILEYETYRDFKEGLSKLLKQTRFNAIVHAAAVSDFELKSSISGKLPSTSQLKIELNPTEKLVNNFKKTFSDFKLISFKLTDTIKKSVQDKAVKKLFKSSASDLVIHNDLSSMSQNHHQFRIYHPEGNEEQLYSKGELADAIGQFLLETKNDSRS